jgi:hypothetical protein
VRPITEEVDLVRGRGRIDLLVAMSNSLAAGKVSGVEYEVVTHYTPIGPAY